MVELKGILSRTAGNDYLYEMLSPLSAISTLDYSAGAPPSEGQLTAGLADVKWESLLTAVSGLRAIIHIYAVFFKR